MVLSPKQFLLLLSLAAISVGVKAGSLRAAAAGGYNNNNHVNDYLVPLAVERDVVISNDNRELSSHHHSSSSSPVWWRVDLNPTFGCRAVTRVVVFNRVDCCQDRIVGATVDLLDENENVISSAAIETDDLEIYIPFAVTDRSICTKAVRITSPAVGTPLHLAEVQVYAISPRDLALEGRASQSCTYKDSDASLAIDGNADGHYQEGHTSHTCMESNTNIQAWWRVDLNTNLQCYVAAEVILYNRQDCCQERIVGSTVEVIGQDDEVLDSYVVQTDDLIIPISFDPSDTSKCVFAVRILSPAAGVPVTLAEVEVYAVSPHNLALRGTASQSCTEHDSEAHLAIDGNTDGQFGNGSTSHTCNALVEVADEEEEVESIWWRVDFPAATCYAFTNVIIYNRQDCCQERIVGSTVQSLTDDDEVVTSTVIASADKVISLSLHPSDMTKCTKAIKIQSPDIGTPLHLAQVEVYGVGPTNLAMGGNAYQSCTHDGHNAAIAINGVRDGKYGQGGVIHTCIMSNNPDDEINQRGEGEESQKPHRGWWRVDLNIPEGEHYYEVMVVIYNRVDCCQERIIGAMVIGMDHDSEALAHYVVDAGDLEIQVPLKSSDPERCIKSIVIMAPDVVTPLHFAEVSVFAIGTNNLAKDGTATQSCTLGEHGASLAINGKSSGLFEAGSVSHTCSKLKTRPEPEQFEWRVDQFDGMDYVDNECVSVLMVVIYNREDCCQERIIGASVNVLDANDNVLATSTVETGEMEISIPFDLTQMQQESPDACPLAVVVNSPGPDMPLHLAEVKVFVDASTDDNDN